MKQFKNYCCKNTQLREKYLHDPGKRRENKRSTLYRICSLVVHLSTRTYRLLDPRQSLEIHQKYEAGNFHQENNRGFRAFQGCVSTGNFSFGFNYRTMLAGEDCDNCFQ